MTDALTGLGLQDVRDHTAERTNIGFAVTSGSNPKRRSRSAGTFPDTAHEHRMSPIQWRRQVRRRSDEIKYWRESAEGSSPVLGNANFMESNFLQISPTVSRSEGAVKESPVAHEPGAETEHHGNFNFGLSTGTMEHQEQIGIEERMVTLEIKLMDFEYAISKLQASLASPTSPPHHRFHSIDESRLSGDSERAQNDPQSPLHRAKRPSEDFYAPSSAHGTPAVQTHQRPFPPSIHTPTTPERPEHASDNRPTSVATTLRAGARGHTSRASLTGLTIEHYTSLMALIRRERSERLRLEDEVLILQGQVQLLMDSQRPSSPTPRQDPRVYDSGSIHHRSPEDTASHSRGRYRRRSSTYTETDTDDASFHEVYVTPVERGEYEREQLGVEEEGVAF